MICLFEDDLAEGFYPLTETRHVADLLVGCLTLRDRWHIRTGDFDGALHVRSALRPMYRAFGERFDDLTGDVLFVNPRCVPTGQQLQDFPQGGRWLLLQGETVVAARLTSADVKLLDLTADALRFDAVSDLPVHRTDGIVEYRHLWDLIEDNGEQIRRDVADALCSDIVSIDRSDVATGYVHVVEPEQLFVGRNVSLAPGVVIDAAEGPVVLGDDVRVMANSVIRGPGFIGRGSTIKVAAKIYEYTSIGPGCKVGGEVENTIMIGFSNKQHDGFLGHSYLGRWVNLGADTNTSDLKNTYGTIRVTLRGQSIDTDTMFVGSLIGDHVKTAINTMLNTGTVIGVGANVFVAGFPPKEIAPFDWGGGGHGRFELERALTLAEQVMARRGVTCTNAERELLSQLWHRGAGTKGR